MNRAERLPGESLKDAVSRLGVLDEELGTASVDSDLGAALDLSDDLQLGLPMDTWLRKDAEQVLYYGNNLFDVWCNRLSADEVVCLSLFDGERTIRDVCEAVAFLSDEDQLRVDVKVRVFLKRLDYLGNNGKPLIEVQRPGMRLKTFDVKQYLIPKTRKTLRLDAPVSLMIMATDECLTDCVYCYACRQSVAPSDLLPLKRLKELIDEAAQLGVANMNLDGGDLLARPGHMEILEHISESGIYPGLSTKGFVSKEKARELHRIGVRRIQIGLDATGEMADYLVGRPGYFRRATESIHNLAEAGVVPRTNSIIVRESLHLLPDLVDFLMTLPLSDIKVAPAFRGMYRGMNEEILLTPLQKKWYRDRMREAEQKYPDKAINWECDEDILDWSEKEREGRFRGRPFCSSGRTQIVIAPDGGVVTCEQSPQSGEYVCGNVRHQSIQEVWNSEQLRQWYEPPRENFKDTECYDCEEFVWCVHAMGHCWLHRLKMYGSPYGPHPWCSKGPVPKERWQ